MDNDQAPAGRDTGPDSGPETGLDPIARIVPPVRPDDRLTVRHRLPDGSATDVLGWLVAIDAGQVRLQPASPDGSAQPVTVPRDRVILARRVPPAMGGRPPSRVDPEELERVALTGWVADAEPLGEWTLRFGNGFTGRANSCLAVGDPAMPYEQAAVIISERYRAAGLEPRAQVIVGSEQDRALRSLGWRETYVTTTVMAQTLVGLLGDHRRDPAVLISSELSEEWWQGYLQYRPVPDPEVARRILTNHPPVGLASVTRDGRIVALGRGHVAGDWLGIAGLWTDPDHRRSGLATMIIRELGHWAARYAARNVYLQVARENAGALAAYGRLGFAPHHDYCYLTPPS